MFVAHSRCAFASCNALAHEAWVQLVGQTSAAWCRFEREGRQFQRFCSIKIRYFINLKYDPQQLPGHAKYELRQRMHRLKRVAWLDEVHGAARNAPIGRGRSHRLRAVPEKMSSLRLSAVRSS